MKKRIVCLILLLGTLGLSLASCFRMPEPLPSDFVEGDEIVVDNNIPFVYTPPSFEEYDPYGDWILQYAYDTAKENGYTYSYFQKWFGNKVIHHYKDESSERYYTVYSGENNSLFYLFLISDGNGNFLMKGYSYVDARMHKDFWNITLLEQDYPFVIMDGKMPDSCYMDYYTAEQIAQNVEDRWHWYTQNCEEVGLESYPKLMRDENKEIELFYRCTREVDDDIVTVGEDGLKASWWGFYCYDISIFDNGTGELHYQHFVHENYWDYRMDQEETAQLSVEEASALKEVFQKADFKNIPTWTPEELRFIHPELTCVIGGGGSMNVHLATMSDPSPAYGIYQIRTAIEDLVRERIEVTSGRVYVDYEND